MINHRWLNPIDRNGGRNREISQYLSHLPIKLVTFGKFIALLLLGFVLVLFISDGRYAVFADTQVSNDGDLVANLELNKKNGDLIFNVKSSGNSLSIKYTFDIYRFYAIMQTAAPTNNNGEDLLDRLFYPEDYLDRYRNYVEEEIAQIKPKHVSCRLKRNQEHFNKIKIWKLPIWETLRESAVEQPGASYKLIFLVSFETSDTVIKKEVSVLVDAGSINDINIVAPKNIIRRPPDFKWYYFPRVKQLAKHYDVMKQLCEGIHSEDARQREDIQETINECNEKLALYDKFKAWDLMSFKEQKMATIRPWRKNTGEPYGFFAQVVELRDGDVTLKKDDNTIININIKDFSSECRECIQECTGVPVQD